MCIDNSAAICSLEQNTHNSEPARNAILTAHNLCQKEWDFSLVWTSSHCNISGNEAADAMAKDGATNQESLCAHTFFSKAWLYAKTRAQFSLNWEKDIPSAS
jgi:ribonuclease HI